MPERHPPSGVRGLGGRPADWTAPGAEGRRTAALVAGGQEGAGAGRAGKLRPGMAGAGGVSAGAASGAGRGAGVADRSGPETDGALIAGSVLAGKLEAEGLPGGLGVGWCSPVRSWTRPCAATSSR